MKKVYFFGVILWGFGTAIGIFINKDIPSQSHQSQPIPITIHVTSKGYEPNNIELKAGAPIKINFQTESDAGCLNQVQSNDLNLNLINLNVGDNYITIKDLKPGVYSYNCGMNMASGNITIK